MTKSTTRTSFFSRAYAGRGSLPQREREAERRDEAVWRGVALSQGPPGGEETETGSEPVAELEERGGE